MKIAVMGGGWLGLPLAVSLQNSGHQVVATRRSKVGLDELSQHGLTGIQFELGEDLQQTKFGPIFSSDLLFLNIPVGRKSLTAEYFLTQIETLLKHACNSNIQNILFVSTTSVYGDESRTVTEQSSFSPNTQSGRINLAIEQLATQYFSHNASVLRLAGLIGGTRHPAKFLAGKTNLANPEQVVNLIHQKDVIKAVHKVIDNRLWGDSFLLSATEHPTRKDYYTWAAKQLGLQAPQFVGHSGNGKNEGKIIDASASLEKLDLKLNYASPYDML
jgi:nucleoside-diphosphate-sugar epimerase